MKHFLLTTILPLLAYVSGAYISGAPFDRLPRDRCIDQNHAEATVFRYRQLLQHTHMPSANLTAQEILADDFQHVSDSFAMLQGEKLSLSNTNTTTLATLSKQAFITQILSAPKISAINDHHVLTAGCRTILWSWIFNSIGTSEYPVKGFSLFTLNGKLQISSIEVEFNNIAWELNLGSEIVRLRGNATATSEGPARETATFPLRNVSTSTLTTSSVSDSTSLLRPDGQKTMTMTMTVSQSFPPLGSATSPSNKLPTRASSISIAFTVQSLSDVLISPSSSSPPPTSITSSVDGPTTSTTSTLTTMPPVAAHTPAPATGLSSTSTVPPSNKDSPIAQGGPSADVLNAPSVLPQSHNTVASQATPQGGL